MYFFKHKFILFNVFLVFLILSFSLSYGQRVGNTRYFVQPTIPLQPFLQNSFVIQVEDAKTDTLFQVLARNGLPISYYRKIITEVCFDDKCRLLKVNIFWNITGRYLGIELPGNEFLSKTDHEPFTLSEYQRLNHLLADSLSPLGNLQYEDLVPNTYLNAGEVDAITGATSKDVLEYVVPGAVYTTYKMWHIVYGKTQKEISRLTEASLTPELLIKILDSPDIGDKYWALGRMDQEFLITNEELRNKVISFINESDYSLAEGAINAFKVGSLHSDIVQAHIYEKFGNSGYNLKRLIVHKLSEAPRLSPEVKFSLAAQLDQLNGGLLADVFKLFQKHNVNDKRILLIITKLSHDENHYKAMQAIQYLKTLNEADSVTKE